MTTSNPFPTANPSRSAAVAILLALSMVFGVVGEGGAAVAHARDTGMPAPEAFVDPGTETSVAGVSDATTYSLSRTTIRFRAGTYTLYRFSSTLTLLRERSVRFSTAVRFRASAQPKLIGNRWFTRINGGPWEGWHVPTPEAVPSAVTTFSQPASIQLAATSHAGLKFYAKGRITTRRVATLYSAQTYQATKSATFNTRQYLLLSNGPLAGRWIRRDAITKTSTATSSTSSQTIAPLVTWKTLVLVYRETDVTFKRADGSSYRLRARMSDFMYDLALKSVRSTVGTVNAWSGRMAALNMTVVDVPHPLTSVEPLGSGYWVAPKSVRPDLDKYAPTGTYDSIIVIFLPKDANGVVLPVPGWGLSVPPGWWSNGAGYSSVKTPLENWWWTEATYPEEVFVHEWMHQVLFFHETTGHTDVDLHEEYKYGYTKTNGTWKAWLSDVMQGKVKDGSRLLGMDAAAWKAGKPTKP